MKKLACVIFEIDENEKVEDVIARIDKACTNVNVQNAISLPEEGTHWRLRLSNMLKNLGENISTMGYGVLFDIMEYVEQEPEFKKHFTLKELYAHVTDKTGKPYAQIERNIRAMIDRIYDNNPVEYVNEQLGIQGVSRSTMTNARFIALIVQKSF